MIIRATALPTLITPLISLSGAASSTSFWTLRIPYGPVGIRPPPLSFGSSKRRGPEGDEDSGGQQASTLPASMPLCDRAGRQRFRAEHRITYDPLSERMPPTQAWAINFRIVFAGRTSRGGHVQPQVREPTNHLQSRVPACHCVVASKLAWRQPPGPSPLPCLGFGLGDADQPR